MIKAKPKMQKSSNEIKEKPRRSEALDVAELAGEILLSNGAEIFRVEDTMEYITKAYGVDNCNTFVLSSGIFMTSGGARTFARVRHIPLSGARLDRVAAVNQLSREIVDGKHTPSEAKKILLEIQAMPGKKKFYQVIASGIGSGCFCYLFGGDYMDSLTACFVGLCLYFFVLYIAKGRLSKISLNFLGGAIVTLFAILCFINGIGHHLEYIIIGSVIPLVPGVSFTNAVRDIMNEDYIAGTVRLLDTLLITFSIAGGVGAMMMFYIWKLGGGLL